MSLSYPTKYQRYESQKWQTLQAKVPLETSVALTVNGEMWTTFMCTPVHSEAMMVGFLMKA